MVVTKSIVSDQWMDLIWNEFLRNHEMAACRMLYFLLGREKDILILKDKILRFFSVRRKIMMGLNQKGLTFNLEIYDPYMTFGCWITRGFNIKPHPFSEEVWKRQIRYRKIKKTGKSKYWLHAQTQIAIGRSELRR